MFVVGFTIIRNAIKYDFPVVESITSVLPLCDEFIVGIGDSEDHTSELIKNIKSPKIKITESRWDDSIRQGGLQLASETNKVLEKIPPSATWIFYIQADEVLHEHDIPAIRESMLQWENAQHVEGLLFDYLHFYGSYSYLEDSRMWYKNEIRIIRNDAHIHSFKDAQGFRKFKQLQPGKEELLKGGSKLKVKPANATIYHYGWVKHPAIQQRKRLNMQKLWHTDSTLERNLDPNGEYDYTKVVALKKFKGTHPAVMADRIKNQDWNFKFDTAKITMTHRERLVRFIDKTTGWRPGGYKNYKLI